MTTVTFPLYNRSKIANITFESAKDCQVDIIHRILLERASRNLHDHLWAEPQRRAISSLTALHVGLDPEHQHQRCLVQDRSTWIRGSFNICVPVHVLDDAGNLVRKVLVRCPMRHKLAEDRYPGTVDEKLSTEVATYVWMQHHCPDIAIPELLGFGFTDGRHFIRARQRPSHVRWVRALWRKIHTWMRLPILSDYVRTDSNQVLDTGYVVLEYIEPETGTMLSTTWEEHYTDVRRRRNLFRGLSRLILATARSPLPRIGSWRFHDDCTITLSNRPLTCGLIILENNGAPRVIQAGDTYTSVEPYVGDLLTLHDSRFLAQANAAMDRKDCQYQMAVQTLLRALAHNYIDRDRRHGPFFMQFSDLHGSNIFVDDQWNIKAIIDLEWICSRPAEMIDVPYWITNLGVDQVGDTEHLSDYTKVRDEFISILEEQERGATTPGFQGDSLATIMRRNGERRSSWFVHCLDSVNAMYTIFDQHLLHQFVSYNLSEKMNVFLSKFWSKEADRVVERKLQERQAYDTELQRMFRTDLDATT